ARSTATATRALDEHTKATPFPSDGVAPAANGNLDRALHQRPVESHDRRGREHDGRTEKSRSATELSVQADRHRIHRAPLRRMGFAIVMRRWENGCRIQSTSLRAPVSQDFESPAAVQ